MASRRTYPLRTLLAVLMTVGFFAASSAVRVWGAWRSIERVEFDLDTIDDRLPAVTTTTLREAPDLSTGISPGQPAPSDTNSVDRIDEGYDVFLIIGSDLEQSLGTSDADGILLAFRPTTSTGSYGIVSIPRDLAVTDPCTGTLSAIRLVLRACDLRVTGPEVVAVAIERLLQIDIDHFMALEFSGFVEIIDRIGGVSICVPHPVSLGANQPTFLPGGCSLADGATALTWMRNRTYLELHGDSWVAAPTNALDRDTRQQELLLEILTKFRAFRSANQITALVEELASAVAVDSRLDTAEATRLALEVRDLSPQDITRIQLPVTAYVTADGRRLLTPTEDPGAVILRALG